MRHVFGFLMALAVFVFAACEGGLFLTGQDVMTPGIAGALAGGMLGAAAIDPRVYRKFVW